MSFSLENVVPWGRSFDEYTSMFNLAKKDLNKRILGCGDGPASFNCILTRRGGQVVSVDPIYRYSAEEIRGFIGETYNKVMEQTRENAHEFVWKCIPSIEELGRIRMAAMSEFLSDYPIGQKQRRYIEASLPHLPFDNRELDLALCSHFLFLYSEPLSLEFHMYSIRELCRVAEEVRIFPLLELGAKKSRHLDSAIEKLKRLGYEVNKEEVPYEFQKGGNLMLTIKTTQM